MKTTFAVLAGLASVASAQGVTALITPTAAAPSSCATSYSGSFEISAVNVSSVTKRQEKRADCSTSSLVITLNGGILKDKQDRTGYVAANYQFQFDGPPQTGAIYTGGWSVCSNGSLALGGSAVFYQCLSGTFYNLYTVSQGAQCSPILIQTSSCGTAAGSGVVGQSSDGQATGTAVASLSSAPVSQISDGQPQAATSAAVITQISDGQVQGPTGLPITQISDGQIQGATTVPTITAPGSPISQISDGQVQGATSTASAVLSSAVISQISDGQVQASTSAAGAPITQISDGQVQGATTTRSALSSAVISQISDGQVQATTAPTLVTSTTSAGRIISQISDGQIQATTGTNSTVATATSTPAQFTGAANSVQVGGSLVAAVIGLAAALL